MPASRQSAPSNDGTSQLLRAGSLILAVGVIAIALLMTVFGGVGVEGAHSAMCLPFGLMLAALGAAKWLRNRSMKRNQ
jgi:hypothetical protein